MWITPEIVAHRGASALAPEHTFRAYDLALEQGADVLELDIRLTLDGEPVVLHDPGLARTAGRPLPIAAVHSSELAAPADPPALRAVLDRYGRSTRWLIELKDPTPALESAVVRAVHDHDVADLTTIQSFSWEALDRLRASAPGIDAAPLLCERLQRRQVLTALWRAARSFRSAGILAASIDAGVVETAHALGLRLRAWTVNAPREMDRLMGLGVDCLITDDPGLARGVVDAARPAPALAA